MLFDIAQKIPYRVIKYNFLHILFKKCMRCN